MLRRARRQGGFTLIELLIVLVILSILAGIVILSVTGLIGRAGEDAYDMEADTLRLAALAYYGTEGSWPTIGETIDIGVDEDGDGVMDPGTAVTYDIIDMCELVDTLYLEGVPRSCAEVAGDDNDNCDSPTASCDCNPDAHYIWALDTTAAGIVHSACIDDDPNYIDGYRDVYP